MRRHLILVVSGLMKSTVLHSMVLIVIAAICLVFTQRLAVPAVDLIAKLSSSPISTTSLILEPTLILAKLIPGMLLGWFTRRHPLVVGALAGIFAQFITNTVFNQTYTYTLVGEVVATAMVLAVAALAGRALRYRFSPLTTQSR